jgi:hypothetical protein
MLNDQAYSELRCLYKKHYNMELSDDELKKEAYDLMFIFAFTQGKIDAFLSAFPLQDDQGH